MPFLLLYKFLYYIALNTIRTITNIFCRMDYSVDVSQYWGHVPGTIRGLSTVSRLYNNTEVKFAWGTQWAGELADGVDVGMELQPGTKILVTVQVYTFWSFRLLKHSYSTLGFVRLPLCPNYSMKNVISIS